MRIAIDAMGGDDAPKQVVKGALLALEEHNDIECILVGNEEEVEPLLNENGSNSDRAIVVHAADTIGMHESPIDSLKKKQDSSIRKAVDLISSGGADALVTAGNTGAAVACTIMNLKLIEGVKRAGIAAPMPTKNGTSTLIDVGANVKCKPEHLYQYGIMAATYTRLVLGIDNPSIGLLSVGEEDQKGNALVRETHKMFAESEVNFCGNLEGQALFADKCNVIVCEGFVGNVILKVSEGFGENLVHHFRRIVNEFGEKDDVNEFHAHFLSETRKVIDYSLYGGAPLLGIDGICIIGHGRSNARAIASAINVARTCIERNIVEHIKTDVMNLDKVSRVS